MAAQTGYRERACIAGMCHYAVVRHLCYVFIENIFRIKNVKFQKKC